MEVWVGGNESFFSLFIGRWGVGGGGGSLGPKVENEVGFLVVLIWGSFLMN